MKFVKALPTVLEIDVLCQALARRQFIDPKLGPCTITHWDTECGQRRIFYRPDDDVTDVHHASFSAVQAWVRPGESKFGGLGMWDFLG